jgi:hypothetical protein
MRFSPAFLSQKTSMSPVKKTVGKAISGKIAEVRSALKNISLTSTQ